MATKIIGNLILSQSTEETSLSHILTYNTQSGAVAYTASSAVGGGGGSAVGAQYEIQYNADGASAFGANSELTFDPTFASLNVGRSNDRSAGSRIIFVGDGLTNRGSNSAIIGNGSSIDPNGINSIAIGEGAVANSNSTMAVGIDTLVAGSGSAVFGISNTVNGSASLAAGQGNTASGNGTIIVGSSNVVAAADSAIFGAINTDVDGVRNVVIGNQNRFTAAASDSLIVGQGNGATNFASVTIGVNNQNSGSGTLVVGNTNRMINGGALAVGTSNFSTQANVYLIGFFLSASSQYQAFVGKYNNATSTPDGAPSGLLFGVGGGITTTTRKTVFAITVDQDQSGSMRIPHNPSNPGGVNSTLTTGSMYWNTTDNKLYVYTGASWRSVLLS